MATFGVEGIRYFSNARAAGIDVSDLTYTFNRCNGFDDKLRAAGHTRAFYWANTDCWETDIRDSDQGGDDVHWVDNVDIFWIETHGNHTADGQALMLYDTPHTDWFTYSGQWELGENWNAEWIMAYSCIRSTSATFLVFGTSSPGCISTVVPGTACMTAPPPTNVVRM